VPRMTPEAARVEVHQGRGCRNGKET
jgi:hypothetical protein